MRKEQSDFGWDWGLAASPAGPWQPAYAVQLGVGEILPRNTLVDVYREGQRNNLIPDQSAQWVLNASIDYIGTQLKGAQLRYTLRDIMRNSTVQTGLLENINSTSGTITGAITIPDGSVEQWWPANMGPQKLYSLTLDIIKSNRSVASVTKRIGFRTIVLNELPISEEEQAQGIAPGNHWHFEINGHPFYAKGSNLIPPDAFWPRVTKERMNTLFSAVIEGNQNMLRVWSSGAYLPDFMYDLADEKGLLLWSEFAFSDALYPVNQEFLDNVYEEAVYQVRRINHHPSLAYWAGGNELENLELTTAKEVDPENYARYLSQYEKLFLTTLFPAVFENSRSISYAPSSTSNGFISLNFTEAPYMQERYQQKENGSIYGETDYYNYDASVAFDIADYPVGRFSNEFGYHSMPSLETWRTSIPEAQLHFNSSFVLARNRHFPPGGYNISNLANSTIGQGQMTMAAQTWYPVPNKTNPTANFSSWCWTTQVFQADYYTSQIAFYRRGSGLPQRTLGSLYWQLEDLWAAPTWSSIDAAGRWKVLHYRARDAYLPVIASVFANETTASFDVWVTSDLWAPATGTLSLEWYTWAGDPLPGPPTLSATPFTVGALNTTRVVAANRTAALAGLDPRAVVARVRIAATGPRPNARDASAFEHVTWYHAAPLAAARLVDPGLRLEHDAAGGAFTVTAAAGVAAWTWLEYPAGAVVTFADNGFWLAKGEVRRVGYTVVSDWTAGGWVEGVTVQSIWNNTLPG